jgi:hypothetical protein
MLNYCCQEEEMSDKQIVIDVTPPSSEAPLSGNVLKTAVSATPNNNVSLEVPENMRYRSETYFNSKEVNKEDIDLTEENIQKNKD